METASPGTLGLPRCVGGVVVGGVMPGEVGGCTAVNSVEVFGVAGALAGSSLRVPMMMPAIVPPMTTTAASGISQISAERRGGPTGPAVAVVGASAGRASGVGAASGVGVTAVAGDDSVLSVLLGAAPGDGVSALIGWAHDGQKFAPSRNDALQDGHDATAVW
jgi:hypothetical protein